MKKTIQDLTPCRCVGTGDGGQGVKTLTPFVGPSSGCVRGKSERQARCHNVSFLPVGRAESAFPQQWGQEEEVGSFEFAVLQECSRCAQAGLKELLRPRLHQTIPCGLSPEPCKLHALTYSRSLDCCNRFRLVVVTEDPDLDFPNCWAHCWGPASSPPCSLAAASHN